MSGGGRPGALVAVKMEVAGPFYGHEGLELLPDFAQLPGGFGGGPGPGATEGPLEEPAEGSAVEQHKQLLLLAGKKPPPLPRGDHHLVGSASAGHAALAPAGPSFPSLRPRGGPITGAVHRLLPETGGGPEVGPGVLQPLLKLPAAADLEQLLLQAGSPGLPGGPASPTGGGGGPVAAVVPGGGGGGAPFLYRSPPPPAQPVTQEQEGFADGFVKALADLHKQNQLLGGAPPPPSAPPPPLSPAPHPGGPCCPPPSRQDSPAVYTTLGGFNPGSPSSGGSGAFFSGPAGPRLPGSAGRALEEPQTVPESPGVAPGLALSSGESPPPPSSSASAAALSPLDAESQERLKAERKRLRNRIAASKCRRRKLERIARLEEKVKALKGQNAELATTASLLRAQVSQLQGRVRSHLSSGCHINASPAPAPAPVEPRETSAC